MRKFLTLLVAVATLLMFPAFASARVPQPGDPGVRVAKFYVGQKFYEVNGVRHPMDAAPVVKNGRTLLPIRYAGYALGLQERDVAWDPAKREATLKRRWGGGSTDCDYVVFAPRQAKFSVNGWPYGKLDQPAEVANGRIMVPMRAVCTALGALCFWDGKERSVTVVTWEKPPEPVPLTVKEVAVPRDKCEATVTYVDGRTEKVATERPALAKVQGYQDCYLDTAEYLKLWGIPESAMLFDPVRGGFLVRGGAGHAAVSIDNCEKPYVAFYTGEKGWWGAFFDRWPAESDKNSDPMFVKDGVFWGNNAVGNASAYLWGVSSDLSYDGQMVDTHLKI
ncbi:copper amine oxidase-like protein [Thermodesulfitimonas autotrophica]|uniref:Copper amine oxidase-like protein n=1 Tax=Thermodesulfitimonas autotrophica TaxID=1894989 RepID=A0A3N5AX37_9THEO|nr:copper amine oxidase N-terminal domain-containing protein [Thermodesulfitimonas autotrophica]RPF49554.1 copper amine oxidase-like protein [Thermodesulfitimonas autotrophica]